LFENRKHEQIFRPEGDEGRESTEERELNTNCRKTTHKIVTSLIIIAACLLLCGQSA